MPRTINHIELLGRVGADPEMRYTPNGTAVTQVRVATDRPRQNGETDTDWHTVTCWAKLAEAVNKYVGKGDRLYVERPPRPEQLRDPGRAAPSPRRDPRPRGRLPRLPQRLQRRARRRAGRRP